MIMIISRNPGHADYASKDVMVHTAGLVAIRCLVARGYGGFSRLGKSIVPAFVQRHMGILMENFQAHFEN